MRKLQLCLVISGIILMLIGCAKDNDPIGFRGEITQLEANGNNQQITILVEGAQEKDVSYDKAYVTITNKTKIYKGDSNKSLSAGELKKGQKVEGVFEGAVAESYPVQGTAKSVRILE